MKKTLLLYLMIVMSSSLFSQGNNQDSLNKKPKDRNMFGLHTPRGLKVNTPGIADGYIIFAVPNSPHVYLLNRRGDVVHQWKGTYGVLNSYLQEDGSVYAGELDPD